jgi:hypothetical protein
LYPGIVFPGRETVLEWFGPIPNGFQTLKNWQPQIDQNQAIEEIHLNLFAAA